MRLKITLFITTLLFFNLQLFSQNAEKEVLLIGTMHTVPNIVKNSYRPLLKIAKKYSPEAIYVEVSMPDDSLSWAYLKNGYSNYLQKFYALSDSLNQTDYVYDEYRLNTLLEKDFDQMIDADFYEILTAFLYKRDEANHDYYKYIKRYGKSGSKKPTRHENGDLTAKLALHLNMKRIFATDDQQTNAEFHEYEKICYQTKQGAEYAERSNKMSKKQYRNAAIAALFGNFGKHTNKPKNLAMLDKISALRNTDQSIEACQLATHYFDERNRRIAKNLATQIMAATHEKSVLIIGAAHIVGVKKELEENYPEVMVKVLGDVK